MRPVRLLQIVIVLVILLNVLYYVAFRAYPPMGAGFLIMVRRGPDCPKEEAIHAYAAIRTELRLRDEIFKNSRIISQDAAAGLQQTETPQGRFWEPIVKERQGDTAVVPQLAEFGAKYSMVERHPIHEGDVVLDCGANVGTFTRMALNSGAKVVVAIEPAPINLECLRRNFSQEIASGRVIVYPKGVWDKDDVLTLNENDETEAMDSFVKQQHGHKSVTVPLTTIDKMVSELGLPRVDFIKMDIEGAEQRALAGAHDTIARYQPRMEISVNHLPEDPVKVPQVVRTAWPKYKVRCLECAENPVGWRILPQILFFQD